MFKKLVWLGMVLLLVLFSTGLSGCNMGWRREFERLIEGDFIVLDFLDGDQELYIEGLSEEGLQKEIIVVPEFLRGKQVKGFRHSVSNDGPSDAYWRSEKLEKVFIRANGKDVDRNFNRCRNRIKIILIDQQFNGSYSSGQTYFSRKRHEEGVSGQKTYIANISYYWNYLDSPNNGYYWLDDVDYGTQITFIPDEPLREGFIFGGWYKEDECINQWDFETDKLPSELLDEEDEIIYQETILYAKWIVE